MSHTKKKPTHLEPSKLGTKEYWDELYTNEISNHAHDPSDTGTVWFDDADAEAKIIEFICSPSFWSSVLLLPSSSSSDSSAPGTEEEEKEKISFLDLGTGNGSLLFGLCDAEEEEEDENEDEEEEEGNRSRNGNAKSRHHPPWGAMLGVDYSARSVELARRIESERRRSKRIKHSQPREEEDEDEDEPEKEAAAAKEVEEEPRVHFLEHDILRGDPGPLLTGPQQSQSRGWHVVLDKGTFDAVSLCPEAVDSQGRRAAEVYRGRVLPLVRPGGVFLVTSCNWTEAELRAWFEEEDDDDEEEGKMPRGEKEGEREEEREKEKEKERWGFEVAGRVAYPSFSFGGVKGQAISTLCFRKFMIFT
ncbi:putative S-adenosylmethionine-dependent methyltransferase of the seven beta-strand family [Biscogniauxia mediterranea]|nr:putative S-adenosylmethionine-dependent methyltransferase of the seven beta-strand family [Biscogniauxia mediterranea]